MECMTSGCNKVVFREQVCTDHYTKHNTEEDFVLQHCLEIERVMELAVTKPETMDTVKRGLKSVKINHSSVHERWCSVCIPKIDEWLRNN
jgi:hypothetical protein